MADATVNARYVRNGATLPTDYDLTGSVYTPKVIARRENEYETVAASQTAQVLGATGAAGDILEGLLIVPATTGAGNVSIIDGNGSNISVFATGTLADLTPIYIPLGIKAVNATTPGWKVTTGANVSVVAVGRFT